jgi:hypothetical protein
VVVALSLVVVLLTAFKPNPELFSEAQQSERGMDKISGTGEHGPSAEDPRA